jgi:hypothetical protein
MNSIGRKEGIGRPKKTRAAAAASAPAGVDDAHVIAIKQQVEKDEDDHSDAAGSIAQSSVRSSSFSFRGRRPRGTMAAHGKPMPTMPTVVAVATQKQTTTKDRTSIPPRRDDDDDDDNDNSSDHSEAASSVAGGSVRSIWGWRNGGEGSGRPRQQLPTSTKMIVLAAHDDDDGAPANLDRSSINSNKKNDSDHDESSGSSGPTAATATKEQPASLARHRPNKLDNKVLPTPSKHGIAERLDRAVEAVMTSKHTQQQHRSPDLVPLSKEFACMRTQLRHLIVTTQGYHITLAKHDKERMQVCM